MILVKIGKQGGRVQEYVMPEGAKIRDLMQKAGIAKSEKIGYEFNGLNCTSGITETVLKDKDFLMIFNNSIPQMPVKVARIGESLVSINVSVNASVNEVITVAGKTFDSAREEIWQHFDGLLTGTQVGLQTIAASGAIYVIEARKETLGHRISNIIRQHTNQRFDHNSGFVRSIIAELTK